MAMDGTLLPMRTATLWAPAPAAIASPLLGCPAAAVIRRHHLLTTEYERPASKLATKLPVASSF